MKLTKINKFNYLNTSSKSKKILFFNSKMKFNTEHLPKRDIKRSKEVEESNKTEINGYSVSNGGKYKSFQINGSGKINSDLITNKLEVNGQANLEGNLEAIKVETNGYVTVNGNIVSKNIEVNGMLKTNSDIDCEYLKAQGMLDANHIYSNRMNMTMFGGSRIGNIVAFNLNLSSPDSLLDKYIPDTLKDFIPGNILKKPSINGIIAHSLVLKDVNANYVGGKFVKIKGNSEVQHVEYTDTLIVEESAKVHFTTKIQSDFNFEDFFGMEKAIPLDTVVPQIQKGSSNVIFNYIERTPNENRVTLFPKLDSLNINLLKQICRESGLSEDGDKTTLIERLIDNCNDFQGPGDILSI